MTSKDTRKLAKLEERTNGIPGTVGNYWPDGMTANDADELKRLRNERDAERNKGMNIIVRLDLTRKSSIIAVLVDGVSSAEQSFPTSLPEAYVMKLRNQICEQSSELDGVESVSTQTNDFRN